jgi:sulfur transfer complex TusBCD TusB component (DsrH family)
MSRSTAKRRTNMWVAYLIPKEDHHLLVEDGIAYMAKGNTQEWAIAKVKAIYEQDEQAMAADGETTQPLEESYVLHVNQV